MKAHIVTKIDFSKPWEFQQAFCFTSRAKAVAKMKELYQAELDKYESDEFYCDFSDAPFIPFAYCGLVNIEYHNTEIQ